MTNTVLSRKGGSTAGPATSNRAPQIVTHEINIADYAAIVTTGGLAQVLYIPADTYFRLLRVEYVTAISLDSGGSGRIDIGDAADDDEFVSNSTTFTAGTDPTLLKGDGSSGDCYTAADAISLKLTGDKLAGGTANATGIVRFVWLQGDVSRNAKAVAGN